MPPGRPAKKKAPIPEGEYKISSGETLDGKDYFDFMFEIEQIRSDPIYFIEDILGFPGPDEQGNPRKMWPVQREIIHDFYGHKYDPTLEPIKKLSVVAGQRCLSEGSLVSTDKGLTKIENLIDSNITHNEFVECNIKVYNGNNWVPVNGICYSGEKEEWYVETESRYSISGSKDHKIYTFDGENFSWKAISDLTSEDYIEVNTNVRCDSGYEFSDIIKSEIKNIYYKGTKSHFTPERWNMNLAAILGYIISEGSVTSQYKTDFTNGERDTLDEYISLITDQFGVEYSTSYKKESLAETVVITDTYITKFIHALGIPCCNAYTKEVPDSILNAPLDIKAAFLSAYYEGDGSVHHEVKSKKCRVHCGSVSEKLIRQIQVMLLEFGIISSISVSKSKEFNSSIKRDNDFFNLAITGKNILKFKECIGFRSPRKKNALDICEDLILSQRSDSKTVPLSQNLLKSHFKRDNRLNMIWYGRSTGFQIDRVLDLYDGKSDIINRISDPNKIYLKVKLVKPTGKTVKTYDLSVPEGNCYVVNGILSHNSSKTTLTAAIMAYELVEVISWENPAKHFGLMTGKSGKGSTIALTCLCPSMKQAKDGVFASMRALIEGNEWFELNFPDLLVDTFEMKDPNKNVIAQVMAAKASTLAGYTNKIFIADEYDYFPDSDKLIDSEAVFTKLANSTETFKRDGKIVVISSLKSQNGRMMAIHNQFKRQEKNRLAKTYMFKTWEINPTVTQEYLLETCEGDRARFYRDFANEPQLSSGLMFPEGIKLDKTLLNVLDSDYSTLPAAIRSIPRVMSIDPAYKNDSFGISVAYKHINQQTAEETVIVDGVKSFRKMGDANALILPSDIRAFIGNTMKNLNIYAFLYDIHMYPEILETVQYEYGVEPLKHIVIKEDYDRWRELQEGLSNTKLRVVYDEELEQEANELFIKIMQGGNAKIDHPWNGKKDLSDTVANSIWYLESDDAIDYTGMTTIGCVASCMGGEVDIYCDYDDEYTDYFC